MRFAAFLCLLPLIPPAPFSHKGRRGSLGVLMPETEDGTQGLAEKPAPARLHAGETSTAVCCIPVRVCPSSPLPPSPIRGEGGVWAS